MDADTVEAGLCGEVGLLPTQAKAFVLITVHGKKTAGQVAARLKIPDAEAGDLLRFLADAGALIELGGGVFEAMHPRFTIVNMYRRMCERRGEKPGRNRTVDSMGAALERQYDDARTK